jgi:hypothetical protein
MIQFDPARLVRVVKEIEGAEPTPVSRLRPIERAN